MIGKINDRDFGAEQYMAQYLTQMNPAMNMDRMNNPALAQGMGAVNAVSGIRQTEQNRVENVVSRNNSSEAGMKSDVMSYFSKATGGNNVNKKKEVAQANQEQNLSRPINTNDRSSISSDGKEAIKEDKEDPSGAFRLSSMGTNIKMTMLNSLLDRYGASATNETPNFQIPDGLSLAEKLNLISMRSTGKAWGQ